jgi:polyhydroxyalkanoate synthesis regulator phasin
MNVIAKILCKIPFLGVAPKSEIAWRDGKISDLSRRVYCLQNEKVDLVTARAISKETIEDLSKQLQAEKEKYANLLERHISMLEGKK